MADVSDWELLVDGVDFGEGPRWHDGKLWYSDFYQASIYTVTADGHREAVHSGLPDRPSGLGWMPDGTLLVVFMTSRRVMREQDGELVVHAEMRHLATGNSNDMVVDSHGNAYVGDFGFDFEANAAPELADLVLVRPEGVAEFAARGLKFPNGSVITPDGKTLIVGESFGQGYEAFDIEPDGSLTNRRRWADTPGMAPDGCTLDEAGGIWFSDAIGSQVVRVIEGGDITDTIKTPGRTFACTLGGEDGRTLYALTAPGSHPDEVAGKAAGAIYQTRVEYPHAGLP